VNRLRLKELDRLRLTPTSSNYNGMDLVVQAGFSNFRGYLRAKETEDKSKELEEF